MASAGQRRVQRGDLRLDLVGARPPGPGCAAQEVAALGDLGVVPAIPVLAVEQHELALRRGPGLAPGVMQEHQGEETQRLRFVGHELHQQPPQPDRLGRELPPDERVAGAGV